MKVEELRKMLIGAIQSMSNYTDRELVEVQCIGDKLKEMALYETFLREKEEEDDEQTR